MKRKLLFAMAMLFAVVGVQKANAYSTGDDLVADGWTKVTDLSVLNEDDYYILMDVTKSGFAMAWSPTGVPVYNKLTGYNNQIWTLVAAEGENQYYIQSAYYEQRVASGPNGWDDGLNAEGTAYDFAVSDGKWMLGSNVNDGFRYLGPWEGKKDWGVVGGGDGAYQRVAANKQASNDDPGAVSEGFYIYSIAKADYEANIETEAVLTEGNGWVKVISADALGLAGNNYVLADAAMWGFAMAHPEGAGRPLYTLLQGAPKDDQVWTMESKGDNFALRKPNAEYFVVPTGELWSTSFNASDENAEFTYTLSDGAWTINRTGTGGYVGRWSNSVDFPYDGEEIASNKEKEKKQERLFSIYQIPTAVASAAALPKDGAMEAGAWYYFDIAEAAEYNLAATTLSDIVYTTISTANVDPAAFDGTAQELSAVRYYVKSSSANKLAIYDSSANLSVKAGKCATFAATFAVESLPNGVKAYTITGIDEDAIILSEPLSAIPAGTPVILRNSGTEDVNETVMGIATAETAESEYLTGVLDDDATVPAGNYVLETRGEEQAFYVVEEDTYAAVVNRAYLNNPSTGEEVKAFYLDFGDGATAIEAVPETAEAAEAAAKIVYNLAGQRVANPVKGIYIVNGQKVLVK